ncbi:hypothetical protein MVG78_01490 [Roseomonas gilardii subsp. gilardii]|uniref:hypothetical protein n=1 Tax=Roseomonas gilardii TaxID=257708 RepID=UPI001FF7BABF|nr:hypothetical protein [Roseomonas gilardii]UPG72899.1 hypothetical protein MVG78_01490 [Roseomonas gilardii subsp. gilardii]
MGLTDPGFPVSRRADAKLRHQLHVIIERALALLDALDGDPDLEPEAIEAEDDEASNQPVTLAPAWVRPVAIRSARGGHA